MTYNCASCGSSLTAKVSKYMDKNGLDAYVYKVHEEGKEALLCDREGGMEVKPYFVCPYWTKKERKSDEQEG